MFNAWRKWAGYCGLWVASAIVLGMWADHITLALLIATLGILAQQSWALFQLDRWIRHDRRRDPPTLGPIMQDIAANVAALYRQNRKRKRKLRKLLVQMQHATAALPDAAVILNAESRVLWCNHAAQTLLGLSSVRDRGLPITYLLRHPDFVAFLAQPTQSDHVELPAPTDDAVLLGVRMVPYGKKQRLLLATDISQAKRVEHMQRDFVANVSHELRTPLTVIGGYLETLIDSDNESERSALTVWQKPLRHMQQQSRRMLQIVEDLLLLVRLESQQELPICRPVNVSALLVDIAEDARAIGEETHHITVTADPELWLSGRERELHSAFANLVLNAVRYTPAGGEITLRWFMTGTTLCCEVEDTGEGIAPQHIPRLTERFYRVNRDRSRSSGGTGLGLSIVHHVLHRHSGQLHITSQLGVGSTFRCEFPLTLRAEMNP